MTGGARWSVEGGTSEKFSIEAESSDKAHFRSTPEEAWLAELTERHKRNATW